MLLIFHDLETKKVNNRKDAELIQIGALKVRFENHTFTTLDSYMSFVRPGTPLNLETTKFTGITQEQVQNAARFPEVQRDFLAWIGEEVYYLCSWSLSDRDIFIDECRRHGLDTDWLKNYNDIQYMYGQKFNHKRRMGLAKTLEALNIAQSEQLHDALSDTRYTFEILKSMYEQDNDIFSFAQNQHYDSYKIEVVHEDKGFSNNPFANLKGLF
ncbi:3'-5' exonuclease [Paenibacillus eucommiae]|uniref:Inhibitor of KinA sporulation pathway (Predicted exonuclease) n=1 Tax=Paenibacillus eucommiae TaxID=1355755 RepID=A0ABS4IVE4_9BACL|nr:3'-5' exonuclease [Paenibacillus eucommiae]MBP1991549.1 inhibitor of KinA sporulation pathway (predicted exonuclease) [Paenibacillus eucommiae]